MTFRKLVRRAWHFIRRERYVSDLEEEMRLHRELRAEQLRHGGMSAQDADAEARRRFGNVTGMTEESRDMWGFGALDQLRQDLRFAARRLRQRPAFSLPVLGVLAIGIGATTAVFSAVDAAILRSLPFVRAHQLVTLSDVSVPFQPELSERAGGHILDLLDVAEMRDVFSHVAAYAAGGLNLADPERPLRVKAGVVSQSFFSTLGVQALHGRTFTVEEGVPDGAPAVVLSHALWRGYYGGADMIGKSIPLNRRTYTVVGVMPAGFSFPRESDLWIVMSVPTTGATFEPFRGWLPSILIGRLRPDVSEETAASRVMAGWQRAIASATGEENRTGLEDWMNRARQKGFVVPLQRELVGDRRGALLILMGATALLLLIACANVANLLLSDSAIRRREIAVRQVLGATRRRVMRQLLAESALLAVAGAVLGVFLAPAALGIMRAMLPANLAGVAPARLDLRVMGFAILLAMVTSMLFGLWPAIGATRGDANAAIKAGGGHGATFGGLGKVRRSLVVAEIAFTVMLLIGAGLMIRSFERLMSENSGVRPEQVATLETTFSRTPPERLRIISGVIDRLQSQPGILAAAAVNDLPMRGGGGMSITMHIPDAPPLAAGERRFARQLVASPGYFSTMGIQLLRGRTFTPADNDKAARVAIISNAAATEWWPGVDPVGRTFQFGREGGEQITVVGVVADVREARLDKDPTPAMYASIYASPPSNAAIVVRGTLPPSALMKTLTDAMRFVEPTQPVYSVRTMEQVIGASVAVAPRRTNTILIGVFAGLALVLSALGVYAAVAYAVAQRTREFGIRAALGATGRDLVRLVSGEMIGVITLGIALGLGGAWMLSRVLGALLYEVDARDPATFVAVPLVLILPAVIATLMPALRAMRVNPTQVMRAD